MIDDSGNEGFSQSFTYNHYLQSWYAFLHLLDINFSDGFCCAHCGTTPSVVVMDATSLAFRKSLVLQNSHTPSAVVPLPNLKPHNANK